MNTYRFFYLDIFILGASLTLFSACGDGSDGMPFIGGTKAHGDFPQQGLNQDATGHPPDRLTPRSNPNGRGDTLPPPPPQEDREDIPEDDSAGVVNYCSLLSQDTFDLPRTNSRQDAPAGSVLEDIIQHLPASYQGRTLGYGNTYFSRDRVTWAHETIHGLSAHIRNYYTPAPLRGLDQRTGFYLGSNKAIVLANPSITVTQASGYVPRSLRSTRYNLYFVTQARSWNDRPLMIMDEWLAYISGAETAIDLYNKGLLGNNDGSNDDRMIAALEFTHYGLSVAHAAMALRPQHSDDHPSFKNLTGCLAERGLKAYKTGINLPGFRWRNALSTPFKTSSDSQILRTFIKNYLGNEWAALHLEI